MAHVENKCEDEDLRGPTEVMEWVTTRWRVAALVTAVVAFALAGLGLPTWV